MFSKLLWVLASISICAYADIYNLDSSQSIVSWSCSKKLGSSHNGTIELKNGQAEIVSGELKNASFAIAMDSIKNLDITDAKMNAKLVGHLKSDDFFGTDKFPITSLKITKATRQAKSTKYDLNAELTIKGKTNPITFAADVTPTKDGYTAISKFNIDRTKWDIIYGSEKGMLESAVKAAVDKIIKDEINFDVKIALTKQMAKTAIMSTSSKSSAPAKKGN